MLKYASTGTVVLQHLQTAGANLGDLDNCAQSRLAAAIALVEATKHGLSEIMHAAGCPDEMTGVEDFLADMMGDHFHLLVKDAAEETVEAVEAFGSDHDELRDRDNPAALDARSQGVGRAA